MTKIAASILSADFADMGNELKRIEAWGADLVHCDVMDGMFVANMTFGPKMISDIRKYSDLPFDVHMMVQAPERYTRAFAEAGADIITVHAEASVHLHRTLREIRDMGVKCGVVLNPATSVTAVENVLDDIDMILVMSVNPGFGGQAFIPQTLSKLRRLREMIDGRPIELEVDGGVSEKNAAQITEAGADILIAGSGLFHAKDPKKTVELMRCSR